MLRPDPTPALDPALPAWITPAWVQRVRVEFQPYYDQPLSERDATEILLTMGNLFRLLKGTPEERHEVEDEDG